MCTDVMGRGMDIPDVHWVIQYDPPSSARFVASSYNLAIVSLFDAQEISNVCCDTDVVNFVVCLFVFLIGSAFFLLCCAISVTKNVLHSLVIVFLLAATLCIAVVVPLASATQGTPSCCCCQTSNLTSSFWPSTKRSVAKRGALRRLCHVGF